MQRRDFIKSAALSTFLFVTTGAPVTASAAKSFKRLKNKLNPSVSEQKHVPGVTAPGSANKGQWFDVKVNVGFQKEHPSKKDHWIEDIRLLVDGQEVAVTEFPVGGVTSPVATFKVRLDKTSKIEAVEKCNLHGIWISEAVTVNVN